MFSLLKSALDSLAASPSQPVSEASLQRATAALLVEVARADFHWEPAEVEGIVDRLARYFELTEEDSRALLAEAREEAEEEVSLYDALKLINERCDEKAKTTILFDCWHVAMMDGTVDKQEEALIRQIADWLYLPHKVFIQTKVKALAAAAPDGLSDGG